MKKSQLFLSLFLTMLLSIFFLSTVSAQSEEGVEGAFGFDDDVQDLNLYAGGSGTETDDPYLIENWEHLHNVRENLDAYFLLSNDLDETSPGYTTFVKDGGTLVDSDKGWLPIGDSSVKFTGVFDGDGHTISNLIINRSNTDHVGLFGYADGATISNLGLVDATVTGDYNVGALVGYANDTTLSNTSASGSVMGAEFIGGLVGYADESTIENSFATGDVTGDNYVGGLVGEIHTNGIISQSYATGTVTGNGGEAIGGLVGNLNNSSIGESYATGNIDVVAASSSDAVGGLLGYSYFGIITESYATGSVTALGSTGAWVSYGGLVGYAESTSVTDSYATGDVTAIGANVGGLLGLSFDSVIEQSHATGQVTGINRVGGLVGYLRNGSSVSQSFATGNTIGSSDTDDDRFHGGLIGVVENGTNSVELSYATGDVAFDTGAHTSGGLIGLLANGTVTNSYAMGDVYGRNLVTDNGAGGLIGRVASGTTVVNTYASGAVSATDASTLLGGLIGRNQGTANITESFWNSTANSGLDGEGGLGKTTAEMSLASTFTDWAGGAWTLAEGSSVEGYGTLRPYLTSVTRAEDKGTASTLFNSGWGGQTDQDQTGADGSAYSITTAEQLQNINLVADQGFDFELSNTIDLNAVSWTPIGDDDTQFSGNFDGKNNTLSNLTINQTGNDYVGLFGYIGTGSSISNLTLDSVNVTAVGANFNNQHAGALAGFSNATIKNIHISSGSITTSGTSGLITGGLVGSIAAGGVTNATANVTVSGDGTNLGGNVGGLIGYVKGNNIIIDNAHAQGSITTIDTNTGGLIGILWGDVTLRNSSASSLVEGNVYIGGLVGYVYQGSTIENSFATGDVTGDDWVGGLVGEIYSNGKITQSYATGTVKGNGGQAIGGLVGNLFNSSISESYATGLVLGASDVGGLVGSNEGSVTISYFDKTTNPDMGDETDYGKTTADMKMRSTFTDAGWDFETIWSIDEAGDPADNDGYPSLQWQGLDDSSPTLSLEAFEAQKLKLYPNPVKSTLHLSTTQSFEGQVEINIYSMLGQKLMALQRQATGSSLEIEVSSLNTGVYILEVISDTQNKQSIKFIKD